MEPQDQFETVLRQGTSEVRVSNHPEVAVPSDNIISSDSFSFYHPDKQHGIWKAASDELTWEESHATTATCATSMEEDEGTSAFCKDTESNTWCDDPPARTSSDWTLQVKVKNTSIHSTYHVHKSVLAGRSKYFRRAFSTSTRHLSKPTSDDLEESHDSCPSRSVASNGSTDSTDQDMELSLVSSFASGLMTIMNPDCSREQCDHDNHDQQQQQQQPRHSSRQSPQGATETLYTSSSSSGTTRIQLNHELLAQVVPIALDYMFLGELDTDLLDEDTATPLYVLAELWEMKSLCRCVQAFWEHDMGMDNLTTYYTHARELESTAILNACEEYCAGHIFQVDEQEGTELLAAIDPLFLLRVVTSPLIYQKQYLFRDNEEEEEEDAESAAQISLRLSLLIALFVDIHQEEMSPLLFYELTNASHLPLLEASAAKALLQLEEEICRRNYSQDHDDDNMMSSFQERAIAALSVNWMNACIVPTPDSMENVESMPRGKGRKKKKQAASTDEETQPHQQSVAVSLPSLSGAALQEFTTQVMENAHRQVNALQQELQEQLDTETRLRQELNEVTEQWLHAQEKIHRLEQELSRVSCSSSQESTNHSRDSVMKGRRFGNDYEDLSVSTYGSSIEERDDCPLTKQAFFKQEAPKPKQLSSVNRFKRRIFFKWKGFLKDS